MDLTTLIDLLFDFLQVKYSSFLPFKGYFLNSVRNFLKMEVGNLGAYLKSKGAIDGVHPTDLIVSLHK